MEKTRFKPKEILPYGMLLTRLFKHVVSVSPELAFDHYLSLIEPCIRPLLITSERHERIGERKDLVNQMLAPPPPLKIILPHLIHLITWLKKIMMNHFTPIPLLLLKKSLLHQIDNENLFTPSPTTTSSSLTPPNAPSKTTSTKETTSSHENTSSSFQSKLQVSPHPTNEPTSPQPQNLFLQNLMDVPPRPSNPQPLQSIPSLDIVVYWIS
ncbi:hypothetical protein Tco_0762831 [Tanacetum coccineum]